MTTEWDCPTQEMGERPWYKLRAENEMLKLQVEELSRKLDSLQKDKELTYEICETIQPSLPMFKKIHRPPSSYRFKKL